MDQTRKLILVLESDPKVARLPIIGIWVTGVPLVQHPFVWASCLRYLHFEKLLDRVCVPPEGFLLVLFTVLHSKPEFYEVNTISGKPDFQFDLYTGYEITSLLKKSSGPESCNIEWELCPVRNGPKREQFDIAVEKFKFEGQHKSADCRLTSPSQETTSDDINPRMKPAPHFPKAMEVRPVVPEVSLIWNDSVPPPASRRGAPLSAYSHQHAYNPVSSTVASAHFQRSNSGPVTSRQPSPPSCNQFITSSGGNCQLVSDTQQDSDSTPRAAVSFVPRTMNTFQNPNTNSSQPFNYYVSSQVSASGFPRTVLANMGGSPQAPAILQSYPQQSPQSQVPSDQGDASPQPQQVSQPSPHPAQLRFMVPASVHFTRPVQAGSVQHSSPQGPRLPPPLNQVQDRYVESLMSSTHSRFAPPAAWLNQPSSFVGAQSLQPQGAVLQQTHQHFIAPVCINSEHGSRACFGIPSSYTQPPSSQPSTMLPQSQMLPEQTKPSVFDPLQNQPTSLPLSRPGLNAGLRNSAQANSTSSSGKSSDDSGLSVTPDRSNPSPKPDSARSFGVELGEAVNFNNVNWSGVPNEVVHLLVQQDVQLKILQAQIQQLLALQQVPSTSPSSASLATLTPTSTLSSAEPTPQTVRREMRSTAVNTSMMMGAAEMPSLLQGMRPAQCASVQTSPQKYPLQAIQSQHLTTTASHDDWSSSQQIFASPPLRLSQAAQGLVSRVSVAQYTPASEVSRKETVIAGQTPADLRHDGPVPLSSTRHDDGGSGDSSINMEHASLARTLDFQTSYSTPSPESASMCVRPDAEDQDSLENVINPDSKEYYDQLINNIKLFLDNHNHEEDGTEVQKIDTVPADDMTCTHLNLLDSTMAASPSIRACPSGTASTNTTMTPHINYLSMMLGSDSSDTSLEINAMAMKYLRDEQLTQMARYHQSPPQSGFNTYQLMRQVLAASLDVPGSPDISQLGMSATNMSMASKKYMERHGLLGGEGGKSLLDTNQTFRLQTDFSMALVSENSSSTSRTGGLASPKKAAVRSPVKREVLQPSPVIREERESSYEEPLTRDVAEIGASPALKPSAKHRYHQSFPITEDSPMFPERYYAPRGQRGFDNCSVATEDDRILDIDKLKQMPKLL